MANGKTIVFARGKIYWAKVFGDPVLNYGKDGKEWKFDFEPSEKSLAKIKEAGITDRLKEDKKGLIKGPFLHFKQPELKKDGSPNIPFRVVDAQGKEWDPETLLGNGTDVDVKFDVVDYGAGKFAGVYARGIRVLRHVPYEGGAGFEPLSEDDEFFAKEDDDPFEEPVEEEKPKPKAKPKTAAAEDLEDDDLPFNSGN